MQTSTNVSVLLEKSIDSHGFWLMNHRDLIKEEMTELASKNTMREAINILNNVNSEFVKSIYQKIESKR
jgi:hypothetical protein